MDACYFCVAQRASPCCRLWSCQTRCQLLSWRSSAHPSPPFWLWELCTTTSSGGDLHTLMSCLPAWCVCHRCQSRLKYIHCRLHSAASARYKHRASACLFWKPSFTGQDTSTIPCCVPAGLGCAQRLPLWQRQRSASPPTTWRCWWVMVPTLCAPTWHWRPAGSGAHHPGSGANRITLLKAPLEAFRVLTDARGGSRPLDCCAAECGKYAFAEMCLLQQR